MAHHKCSINALPCVTLVLVFPLAPQQRPRLSLLEMGHLPPRFPKKTCGPGKSGGRAVPLSPLTTLAAKPGEAGTKMREAGRAVEEKRGKPGGFTGQRMAGERGGNNGKQRGRKEGPCGICHVAGFSTPLPTATLKVSLSHPLCGWGREALRGDMTYPGSVWPVFTDSFFSTIPKPRRLQDG